MKRFMNKAFIIAMGITIWLGMFAPMYAGEIKAGDFESLKNAIEAEDRDGEIVVPEGEYNFTSTVNITKDLVLKNEADKKVVFKFGLQNDSSDKLGDTMINVASGSLVIDADKNENFVFDGNTKPLEMPEGNDINYESLKPEVNTNTSDKGVFLTIGKNGVAEINKGTFENSGNGGMQTAPIFVDGGKLTLNDGIIRNNVLSHQETIANVKMTEDKDPNSGYAKSAGVAIRSGLFIMNGGEFYNNHSLFNNGAAIAITGKVTGRKVDSGKVVINGGKLAGNTVGGFKNKTNYSGGAIYVGIKGELEINDGELSGNYAQGGGGAIFGDWGSKITLNGGSYLANSAAFGGAVATFDRFINYNPEGTTTGEGIHGVYNQYGIKDHDLWKNRYGFGTKLIINDGHFKGNQAVAGGAIYISSDDTEINGGTIEENLATRFGGGLYLSTNPYVLKINNALISDNRADENATLTLNGLQSKFAPYVTTAGSGGGIWFCPVGAGEFNSSNGIVIIDNRADNEGDDFTSVKKETVDGKPDAFSVKLADRQLGGASIKWYNDAKDNRYKDGDTPLGTIDASTAQLALKGIFDVSAEDAKALAKENAKVLFLNNTSRRGGAIGSNGTIIFGDPDKEFDLKVNKKWSDNVESKNEIKVNLYVVKNEKKFLIDSGLLNEANGWTHSFRKLPLEAGNEKIAYLVEEVGDEYVTTYDNASFTTEGVNAKDEIITTITNDVKPKTPDPEQPEKPETPDPEQPEKPETPDPDKPEKPETPDPEQPEKPESPDPEQPEKPETPDPDKPEKPETPDPEQPEKPESPDPDKPEHPEPNKPEKPKREDKAPKTGDDQDFVIYGILSGLAIIGAIRLNRKTNQ